MENHSWKALLKRNRKQSPEMHSTNLKQFLVMVNNHSKSFEMFVQLRRRERYFFEEIAYPEEGDDFESPHVNAAYGIIKLFCDLPSRPCERSIVRL